MGTVHCNLGSCFVIAFWTDLILALANDILIVLQRMCGALKYTIGFLIVGVVLLLVG